MTDPFSAVKEYPSGLATPSTDTVKDWFTMDGMVTVK
jgi:hypothetical protein